MEDKRAVREKVLVGNGADHIRHGDPYNNRQKGKVLKPTNVLYAPEFKQNIISISRIFDKG